MAKPNSCKALLQISCGIFPEYRKKMIYEILRRYIGKILRVLCRQHGVELVEGYAMKDHIHMLLMILPKYSVSNTICGKVLDTGQLDRYLDLIQRNALSKKCTPGILLANNNTRIFMSNFVDIESSLRSVSLAADCSLLNRYCRANFLTLS